MPTLPRIAWFAALIAVVFGVRLAAQDVIVTPLAWRTPAGAPDELPSPKRPIKIAFPKEIQATPDIGYVIYDLYLDKKASIPLMSSHATLPLFTDAIYPDRINRVRRWNAGRRAGEPINTDTTFAIIFNPASAGEKLADSTPRLLEVVPIRHPVAMDTKPEDIPNDHVILADVTVDETGRVTAVDGAPPESLRELSNVAKIWRFAPARKNGQPVAARVRVPFVVTTEKRTLEHAPGLTPPRVVSQKPPVYPLEMRVSRMRGEVLVDFVVDIEGRVRQAFVSRSLNPSFDDAALDAVREWRFEPGQLGGRAVSVHMGVPIIFELEQTFGGGNDSTYVNRKADLSKLPEEFRYDRAPVPVGIVRPIYPYALLREGKTGSATVNFVIGPSGRVDQIQVVQASAPEFGAALAAAIECFTFKSAYKGGRPSSALQAFETKFEGPESSNFIRDEDLDLLKREKKTPASIHSARELDTPLNPISRRPATFPASVGAEVNSGNALIEFLVDEEGRVRLPRIVKATDNAFGYAAVQCVAAWRFDPPLRGGLPVATRIRVPIEFSRK